MDLVFEAVAIATPARAPLLDIPSARIGRGLTALTGPNGAGKSTLLRTIFGLHPLGSGAIRLGDLDSRADRTRFLAHAIFQPQNFSAYPELTGLEFLTYFLRLRGRSAREARSHCGHWIERVGLAAARNQRAGSYSQGMLQRLGLAFALQADVPLCVLDEPFAGVDPGSRDTLSDLLAAEAAERIVLICTHHVDEMQARGAAIAQVADGSLRIGGGA